MVEFLLLFTGYRKVLGRMPGVITLKGDVKFKGKLTCGLKNDLRSQETLDHNLTSIV